MKNILKDCLIVSCAVILGITLLYFIEKHNRNDRFVEEVLKLSVEKGFARYNPTNGNFEVITNIEVITNK